MYLQKLDAFNYFKEMFYFFSAVKHNILHPLINEMNYDFKQIIISLLFLNKKVGKTTYFHTV